MVKYSARQIQANWLVLLLPGQPGSTESTKSPKRFLFEVGKMEGQDLKQWINLAAEADIVKAMLTGCSWMTLIFM